MAKFGAAMTAEYQSDGRYAPAHWVQFVKHEVKKNYQNENAALESESFGWSVDGGVPYYWYPHQITTDTSASMTDHPGRNYNVPQSFLARVGNGVGIRGGSFNDLISPTDGYKQELYRLESDLFQTYLIDDCTNKPVGYFQWGFQLYFTLNGIRVVLSQDAWHSGVDDKVWPSGG
jgi:hypothetical protein